MAIHVKYQAIVLFAVLLAVGRDALANECDLTHPEQAIRLRSKELRKEIDGLLAEFEKIRIPPQEAMDLKTELKSIGAKMRDVERDAQDKAAQRAFKTQADKFCTASEKFSAVLSDLEEIAAKADSERFWLPLIDIKHAFDYAFSELDRLFCVTERRKEHILTAASNVAKLGEKFRKLAQIRDAYLNKLRAVRPAARSHVDDMESAYDEFINLVMRYYSPRTYRYEAPTVTK